MAFLHDTNGWTLLTILVLGALALRVVSSLIAARILRAKMPPGPDGLPFIGNILQLSKHQWLRFLEWSEQYGPIFSLNLAGQRVVVLNDFTTSADLLDRRSTIYSSRPRFIMSGELVAGNMFFGLFPYGNRWRRFRRAAHEGFVGKSSVAYQPVQEKHAALLVSRILQDAQGWDAELMRCSASSVLSACYGWTDLDSTADSVIHRINDIPARLGGTIPSLPGAGIVQFLPWMLYLPEWLAGWKRKCREWHESDTKVFTSFLDDAENSKFSGSSESTFTAALVGDEKKYDFSRKEAAWLTGTMIISGVETVAGIQVAFVLAMVLYPDVMRRAQAEIDAVIGRDRTPSFSDRDKLPYIEAIVKEVIRWRPVDPLGVPRRSTEDDWYKGYFIPAGTVVIFNVWAMNRNPKYFPDAEEFRPERYLDDSGQLAEAIPDTHGHGHFAFGSGRRICPGRDFANQAFFINIATLLWAFDFEKALDSAGQPIIPSRTDCIDEGIMVRPAPFKCAIKPRSTEVGPLINSIVATFS